MKLPLNLNYLNRLNLSGCNLQKSKSIDFLDLTIYINDLNKLTMKKTTLIASFGITLFASMLLSCNSTKNSSTTETKAPDHHTSQTSLDWQGTYSGTLPCADCDGIETTLKLNNDLTYILTTEYKGKDNAKAETSKGSFTWKGNTIKLGGISGSDRPSQYKVEENRIRQLDMDGNIITGALENKYILSKHGNPEVEDKRWQLIELNGKPISGTPQTHYIIMHSKDSKMEAKANCNQMNISYTIKNQFQLTIGQGISTLMACPDNLEQEFNQTLSKVDNLTTDGNNLSFNKGRMAPLMRFQLVK